MCMHTNERILALERGCRPGRQEGIEILQCCSFEVVDVAMQQFFDFAHFFPKICIRKRLRNRMQSKVPRVHTAYTRTQQKLPIGGNYEELFRHRSGDAHARGWSVPHVRLTLELQEIQLEEQTWKVTYAKQGAHVHPAYTSTRFLAQVRRRTRAWSYAYVCMVGPSRKIDTCTSRN